MAFRQLLGSRQAVLTGSVPAPRPQLATRYGPNRALRDAQDPSVHEGMLEAVRKQLVQDGVLPSMDAAPAAPSGSMGSLDEILNDVRVTSMEYEEIADKTLKDIHELEALIARETQRAPLFLPESIEDDPSDSSSDSGTDWDESVDSTGALWPQARGQADELQVVRADAAMEDWETGLLHYYPDEAAEDAEPLLSDEEYVAVAAEAAAEAAAKPLPEASALTMGTPGTSKADASANIAVQAALGTPSPMVQLDVAVRCQTQFGENVVLVGSAPSLGGWDVSKALTLAWTDGHVWRGSVALEPGKVECKAVLTRKGKDPKWEAEFNHHVELKASSPQQSLSWDFRRG